MATLKDVVQVCLQVRSPSAQVLNRVIRKGTEQWLGWDRTRKNAKGPHQDEEQSRSEPEVPPGPRLA